MKLEAISSNKGNNQNSQIQVLFGVFLSREFGNFRSQRFGMLLDHLTCSGKHIQLDIQVIWVWGLIGSKYLTYNTKMFLVHCSCK
jgi:hypothetical protein